MNLISQHSTYFPNCQQKKDVFIKEFGPDVLRPSRKVRCVLQCDVVDSQVLIMFESRLFALWLCVYVWVRLEMWASPKTSFYWSDLRFLFLFLR